MFGWHKGRFKLCSPYFKMIWRALRSNTALLTFGSWLLTCNTMGIIGWSWEKGCWATRTENEIGKVLKERMSTTSFKYVPLNAMNEENRDFRIQTISTPSLNKIKRESDLKIWLKLGEIPDILIYELETGTRFKGKNIQCLFFFTLRASVTREPKKQYNFFILECRCLGVPKIHFQERSILLV